MALNTLQFVDIAKRVGIKVPWGNLDDYYPHQYPHWHVFVTNQLTSNSILATAYQQSYRDAIALENAKIVADIPLSQIGSVDFAYLQQQGWRSL